MAVTFDEGDWSRLSPHDKQAVRKLRGAADGFEPLAKFAGLGPRMVESLIALGLAEEGPSSRPLTAQYGYRLTKKGWLASEWLSGNKMREYPEG